MISIASENSVYFCIYKGTTLKGVRFTCGDMYMCDLIRRRETSVRRDGREALRSRVVDMERAP